MYHCTDCGKNFENPQKIKEGDGGPVGISRIYFVCPYCKGDNIREKKLRYCKCCGRSMGYSKNEYCSVACRSRGEKLYENQRLKYIHIKESPIYKTVRMLDEYNKNHNTDLSYGMFTATVLPKILKGRKNGKNKRKIEVS